MHLKKVADDNFSFMWCICWPITFKVIHLLVSRVASNDNLWLWKISKLLLLKLFLIIQEDLKRVLIIHKAFKRLRDWLLAESCDKFLKWNLGVVHFWSFCVTWNILAVNVLKFILWGNQNYFKGQNTSWKNLTFKSFLKGINYCMKKSSVYILFVPLLFPCPAPYNFLVLINLKTAHLKRSSSTLCDITS